MGDAIGAYLRVVGCIAAVVIAIVVTAAFGFGYLLAQPKSQTFDQWWTSHQQVCPECGGSPDHAMCMEAFERWKEEMKNH